MSTKTKKRNNEVTALSVASALLFLGVIGWSAYWAGRADEHSKYSDAIVTWEIANATPSPEPTAQAVPVSVVFDKVQCNNLKVLKHSDFNSITVCDTQADELNNMSHGFIELADYDSDDPDSGPYIMIEDGHNNLLTISAKGITREKVKAPF